MTAGTAVPPAAAVVVLAGNPNTGKTTLFNRLTGLAQRVGNYPGVTVERKTGTLDLGDRKATVVDTPGAYSLSARSADEAVTADVLTGRMPGTPSPDLIVAIADASNLPRNLYLVTQLLELGRPMVVALNMMDAAGRLHLEVDPAALARKLGVPVIPTVASRGNGIAELREAIGKALATPEPAPAPAVFPAPYRGAFERAAALAGRDGDPAPIAEGMRLLFDKDGFVEERFLRERGLDAIARLEGIRRELAPHGFDPVTSEAEFRYRFIRGVAAEVVRTPDLRPVTWTHRIDRVLTHRVAGLAIFAVVMALVFQSIFTWAVPFMDGIDAGIGGLAGAATARMPEGALASLLSDGIIAGVGAVVIFLPQILILAFFIALLEDTGYMARAAYLMDRIFRKAGLSGNAMIPLLSSFACAIPGIMAARTIPDRRDRFTTILIAPLMSCSARLPVYILLIAAIVPAVTVFGPVDLRGLTMLGLYLIGPLLAVPIAMLLKRTMFRGPTPAFVLELPAYQVPSARSIALKMFQYGREFVVRAGTIIFAITVVIWALAYYPRSEPLPDETAEDAAARQIEGSLLGRMGHAVAPAFRPLGWDWKITTGTLAAFPAREVIVSTFGVIYRIGDDADEESVGLRDRIREERRPDGTRVFTPLVALGLMVFFALCAQCGSTLAVIRRETGSWRLAAFSFVYMTGLAYLGALVVVQGGRMMGFA